jgi:signal transduction histidine kinase/ligand-binding sensor domain-containing protein
MWFGTDNGLARFDGRRIQNFSLGSAESDRVIATKTSSAGEIWVGTQNGALIRSGNAFRPIEGTSGFSISVISFGRETLLGTGNGILLRVKQSENGTFTAEPVLPQAIETEGRTAAAITGLAEREDEIVITTAGRGAFVLRDGSLKALPTTPSVPGLNALEVAGDGALWIGTDAAKSVSGVQMISNGRSQRIAAPTSRVISLEANDGGVWAGTERYGLFQFEGTKLKKTFTFENTSGGLRSDTIYTLFTDREGVLWIGTNRGVSRFDRMGATQQTVSDIPNSNFIRSLFHSSDGILHAGSNRGLFEYVKENWRPVAGFADRVIYSIHQSGPLLFATASGLLDARGGTIASGDVRSIATFGKTYAAIVGRGVVDISGGKQDVVVRDETVSSLFATGDRLWIGTSGRGLFSFDGKAAKLEISAEVLKSGTIWKVAGDTNGSLWIAGQHGVFRVRDGQAEEIVKVEDVRDVFIAGNDVWAATATRGLVHARQHERFGWIVSSVSFEQGLPSEKAFAILPVEEGLLIGTNRGVVTYRPATIAPKLIASRVISQREHDLAELDSTIALDHPQNALLIEVAGQSSRTFPEEFQYAFTLKNSNGDVVDSRFGNDAQYAPADLRSGDYTIEAVAFDRDLNESEPLAIRFSIARAPFPWTATALGVLLILALVGLTWAIVEHRRMRERNRELAAARFDLANEAERERRRIARDLHDQTLADLRSLMILSDRHDVDSKEFRGEIEAVSGEIRRICEDLSPSVLENVGLVAALQFLLGRTIGNNRFSAADDLDEKITMPPNVQIQVYRIVQEVLTNIRSHSTADLVQIKVDVAANHEFTVRVDDNGEPFEVGSNASGRGIANIRARSSLINATVSWNRRGNGNTFSLSVPQSDQA